MKPPAVVKEKGPTRVVPAGFKTETEVLQQFAGPVRTMTPSPAVPCEQRPSILSGCDCREGYGGPAEGGGRADVRRQVEERQRDGSRRGLVRIDHDRVGARGGERLGIHQHLPGRDGNRIY